MELFGQTIQNSQVNAEWEKAINVAEELIDIDPSDSEAKFFLVYGYKKLGKPYPDWVGEPEDWAYGTIDDSFYRELAKDLIKKGH